MNLKESIARKFHSLAGILDERGRRLWAAAEARELGHGGQTLVSEATGLARHTIRAGVRELEGERVVPAGRQRMAGAGRPTRVKSQAGLEEAIESLISPGTRGDPESPLRWTTKSLRNLSDALHERGFVIGRSTLGQQLHRMGYSLQSTQKTSEGSQHIDRDAQFQRIHDAIAEYSASGEPAISVDAKKKELVGDFAQGGQEWQPKGQPVAVRVHDFVDPQLGKVAPYGVYDIAANTGWVSVGISADTGEFATATIQRWWDRIAVNGYDHPTRLLITADGGGSNGSRLRAWKLGIQALANKIGIPITVMHLPPGTSKWNRIEHKLFCHITQQFRGRPLMSRELIVELIAHTKTRTGLKVAAELDETIYLKGKTVSDEEMAALNIQRDEFHGEWNYTISPQAG
jgi:transposase